VAVGRVQKLSTVLVAILWPEFTQAIFLSSLYAGQFTQSACLAGGDLLLELMLVL
jgi:hypothetical protein